MRKNSKIYVICLIFFLLNFCLSSILYSEPIDDKCEYYRNNNKIDEGILYLKKKLKKEAKNLAARNYLAEFLWADKNFKSAEIEFKKVLKLDSDFPYSNVGLAYVLKHEKKYDEAIKYFFKSSKIFKKLKNIDEMINLFLIGNSLLIETGKLDKAEENFKSFLIEKNFDKKLLIPFSDFMINKGRVVSLNLFLKNNFEKTKNINILLELMKLNMDKKISYEHYLKTGLTMFPDNIEILYNGFIYNLKKKNFKKCSLFIEKVSHKKKSIKLLKMKLLLSKSKNNIKDFLIYSQKLIKLQRNIENLKYYLEALIKNRENSPTFIKSFREYLKITGDKIDLIYPLFDLSLSINHSISQKIINIIADLYPYSNTWSLLQAKLYINENKKNEALKIYEDSLETQSPSLETYLEISELLYDLNKTEENRLILTQATGLFKNSSDRFKILKKSLKNKFFNLSYTLYKLIGRNDNPQKIRKFFYDLSPDILFSFYNSIKEKSDLNLKLLVAETKSSIKESDDAEIIFRNILKTHPDNKRALLGMGNLLLERAEFDKAEILFQKALANGNNEVLYNLAKINYVNGNMKKAKKYAEKSLSNSKNKEEIFKLLSLINKESKDYKSIQIFVKKSVNLGKIPSGEVLDKLKDRDFINDFKDNNFNNRIDELVIRFRLSLIYSRQKKYDKAIKELKIIKLMFNNINRIDYYLGKNLIMVGKVSEGVALLKSCLENSLDLKMAEDRDQILDSPYPCLTSILANASIITGDFERTKKYILGQIDAFLRGTTDLVTDNDIMRGDVTFYPPFKLYFKINGIPQKSKKLYNNDDKIVKILKNIDNLTDKIKLSLKNSTNINENYIYVYTLLNKNRARIAFKLLKKLMLKDKNLNELKILMGIIYLINKKNN